MEFSLQPMSLAAQPIEQIKPKEEKRCVSHVQEQAENTWQTDGTKESNVSNEGKVRKERVTQYLPTWAALSYKLQWGLTFSQ
eukprot:1161873-Pelagomonas_calceolata.AAC.1